MTEQTVVYEPPTFALAGDFGEVTLGKAGWGWDAWKECYIFCD